MTKDALPYWLVNVAREEWPEACPEFLLNMNERDRAVLSTRDVDYKKHTWDEVVELAKINRPDLYHRVPSDLRNYLAYNWKLKLQYGSVMDFILQERLHWTAPVRPRGSLPFADPDDVKILVNDWPYGVDAKIVHLLVWTKFELEEDPATGDLALRTRTLIDDYVQRTFDDTHLRPEQVRLSLSDRNARLGFGGRECPPQRGRLTRTLGPHQHRWSGSGTGPPSSPSPRSSTFTSCSTTQIRLPSVRSRTVMFLLARDKTDKDERWISCFPFSFPQEMCSQTTTLDAKEWLERLDVSFSDSQWPAMLEPSLPLDARYHRRNEMRKNLGAEPTTHA